MEFSARNTRMIPANPTLKQNLDALMQASLEVEQNLRHMAGRYLGDAKPAKPAEQSTTSRMAKGGFTILLEQDGSASIIPMGDMQAKPRKFSAEEFESFKTWFAPGPDESHSDSTKKIVREAEEEPYEMMTGENFERAKEESHKPSKRGGNFEPVQSEGHSKNPVGDAALQMREAQDIARRKQQSISDSMKRESRRQFTRNANIAAAMKEASNKMWGNK